MTDDDTLTERERDSLLAAEYVMGVLDADARRDVERRAEVEPLLAADITRWEQRLGGLADEVAPVAPPRHVWPAIQSRIGGRQSSPRSSRWASLALWRRLAIGATAVAAACLVALIYVGVLAPSATLVASLDEAGGRAVFIATVAADGESVLVVPAVRTAADGRARELWVIPPGGTPHSLGLIEVGGPTQIRVPADRAPYVVAQATLAVSLEPPGGSPTGLPTGPVVASGALTRL